MASTEDCRACSLKARCAKGERAPAAEQKVAPKRKKAADSRQTGMKLPIKDGKVAAGQNEKTPAPAAKPVRKRA